ncbi:MAG: hypothetical protein WCS96_14515 [Victivallales bacterium]
MKNVFMAGLSLVAVLSSCVQAHSGSSEGLKDDKEVQTSGLVMRKDYDVGKDWQPRQIMGRNFWHMLQSDRWASGFFIDSGNSGMQELEDKPLFKESGVLCWNESITVPGSNKVSISDMTPAIMLELIEKRSNAPFFIMPESNRGLGVLKRYEHDNETYNAWKKAHPNFMGSVNAETCNDFLTRIPGVGYHWPAVKADLEKKGDKEFLATIVRELPKPQNREELTALYLKVCDASRRYFFNDADKASYMAEAHCLDHLNAESSSGVLTRETTNTAGGEGSIHYRHQTGLAFTRGAARQYSRNWLWYIAGGFYNGYDDKGSFSGDNYPDYRLKTNQKRPDKFGGGIFGPGCGMSPSLFTRDMLLAYLSGSNFVCPEGWWQYLHETAKDGAPMWDLSSPHGKAWEDWFEFTRKNPDRGVSYTPVALLIPFEQGYPVYGGKSWGIFNYERPDWMIDAFMFTIIPHSPVTKKGDEGALANSPYGDIYDVIVPNTPKKPVSLDVLENYKVAVMLGRYQKSKALAERLMEYVKNGGTLIINMTQVNEFFPAEFLGVERAEVPDNVRDMYAVKVKLPVRSTCDGRMLDLPENESYEMEAVKLKGAVPLLEDAGGNVLACKNSFGKGNVIISTIDCLVPKTSFNGADDKVLNQLVYGKKFPFVEYFLKNIVGEVLPLEVRGDVEYGLNKLPDGWLLYLINNKGVTKFTNKEQTLDMTKTAKVEVSLRNIKAAAITELREQKTVLKDDKNNSFSIEVPPGNVRVLKIKN